jgi:hypothetical protein
MVSVKNLILLTVILFSLGACKKTVTQNYNSSIVGKLRLSEYLADRGDGSGTWHLAASLNPSYLEFKEDGTLSVSLYSVNSWDHFQVTSDSTIILFRGSDQFTRKYHFSTTLLTLSGSCIEVCEERYIPAL